MRLSSFFLGLMVVCSVESSLQDHFKKIEGKADHHQMKNIDFIYMINLDERPEKLERTLQLLAPYGIHPYRFSAVNGWNLSLEVINDIGVAFDPRTMRGEFWGTRYPLDGGFKEHHEIIASKDKTYFCHCMTRGAMGCFLSHLSVLQDAYDSGYQTIWIIEDDIEIDQDPRILSGLIEKLDALTHKRWDVLYTDQDTRNDQGVCVPCSCAAKRPNHNSGSAERYALKKIISPDFRRIGARYGTYSMIVRRSGMKKILDFFKTHQIFLPYDLDIIFPSGIRFYTVLKDVVGHQRQGMISDNGSPYYLQGH